jgi:hypothetical protein
MNSQTHPNAETISTESVSVLGSLAFGSHGELEPVLLDDFLADSTITDFVNLDDAQRLAELFNLHGSDKSSKHDYHKLYQPIISRLLKIRTPVAIAEIGLGTTRIKNYSNMGPAGNPGASLLAFRDYSEDLFVFGGDVDRDTLINGERLKTKWVDQLQLKSLELFFDWARPNLAIDDGLHLPHANMNFLAEAMKVTKGSSERWIVIEDISSSLNEFWGIIRHAMLHCKSWLIETKSALVLVCLVKGGEL